jgi:orotidine-5'-phosphate decarboxylase
MADIRLEAGDMPFLIPGIGAQGGDLEASVHAGNRDGVALISVSRSVLYAAEPGSAAMDYNSKINEVLGGLKGS